MSSRIAVKRLTKSDLTIFEWHFKHHAAGNQKSINLNRDVFIDELYPNLPAIASAQDGVVPLNLFLYGPGMAGEHNLQRKILKGASYKNWRLDGEFIANPADEPDRYNILEAGDLLVVQFVGDFAPRMAKAVILAFAAESDQGLCHEIAPLLKSKSMRAVSCTELQELVGRASPRVEHPIHELTLEGELEDASLGGSTGRKSLYRRRSGTKMTRGALEAARKSAEQIGRLGEELISVYFEGLVSEGAMAEARWVSDQNAVAPYDFEHKDSSGVCVKVDVKTTAGEFDRRIHVSLGELEEMAHGETRYDLYRLYDVTDEGGRLRIAEGCREFAKSVLSGLSGLPDGVVVDGVSVCPANPCLAFNEEIALAARMEGLEEGENAE